MVLRLQSRAVYSQPKERKYCEVILEVIKLNEKVK